MGNQSYKNDWLCSRQAKCHGLAATMSLQGASTPPNAPSLLLCGLGSLPARHIWYQRVEMVVHAPWSVHPPLGTIKRPPEFSRHCATLSACPCSLLQSCLCTQWTMSGAPSPQQLLSLLGFPPTHWDLTCGPSPSCQGGRVLHAPWGMHLTRGTCKQSPETSACSIHCNHHITDPLKSHHHLEWHPGDAASPSH